jgi:hypothetical protein
MPKLDSSVRGQAQQAATKANSEVARVTIANEGSSAAQSPGETLSYAAFGLRIASDIPLPELAPSPSDAAEPDLHIRIGSIPIPATSGQAICAGVTSFDQDLLLDFEPARYFITGGCDILVEPKSSTLSRDLRGYLLGSALGAALHQRKLLPLHANAVVGPSGAVAFAGPSGAGKSTLAAHLFDAGYRVLSDDVSVVTLAGQGATIQPGVARIKLWADALHALGRTERDLERIWDGEEKYSLPLPPGAFEPATLRRVVLLSPERDASDLRLERLSGARAVSALVENIYRWEFASALGSASALFAQALDLTRLCDVFELSMPKGIAQLGRRQAELSRLFSF